MVLDGDVPTSKNAIIMKKKTYEKREIKKENEMKEY